MQINDSRFFVDDVKFPNIVDVEWYVIKQNYEFRVILKAGKVNERESFIVRPR